MKLTFTFEPSDVECEFNANFFVLRHTDGLRIPASFDVMDDALDFARIQHAKGHSITVFTRDRVTKTFYANQPE